jgi:alanyl-tRNA synthetase
MKPPIYYTDPQCTEFEAEVVRATISGGRPAVVLDSTAFYPTSGGQPHDTGTLGEARVVEVVEEDGEIIHVLDRELPVGRVGGRIDWDRRFDHMQQHTGQHVLSAAFDKRSAARTVGFHLGAEVSTIDLSIPLSAEAIATAEAESNRVVWEDRPVSIRFVGAEEAAALPLRKEPDRSGILRVIDVEGYDMSACGGTHVARTGSIGAIAVLSSERLRGGTRIEFVCGSRAVRALHAYRDAVAGCIRHVSVAPEELPAAIERLQGESKDQRKAIKAAQERLAGYQAAEMAGRAEAEDGVRRLVEAVEGQDQNGLKAMATAICAAPGFEVALFSASGPVVVVIARSRDGRLDAAAALRKLLGRFGGRGGGKADLAQAGGLTGSLPEILDAARAALRDAAAGRRS